MTNQRNGKLIAVSALSIFVGVAFIASGCLKLGGFPNGILIFNKIGIGQWFRYVTGVLEVTSGIALFLPKLRFYAALWLAWMMLCAMNVHFFKIGGNWIPSTVLFILSGTIAKLTVPRASVVTEQLPI